jgi:hypothetical protein
MPLINLNKRRSHIVLLVHIQAKFVVLTHSVCCHGAPYIVVCRQNPTLAKHGTHALFT